MESHISSSHFSDSKLIENMLDGYALFKIISDKQYKPIDYVFIEINKRFEELTGLKSNEIIGKKITEVNPGDENKKFNRIDYYGEIALHDKKGLFEAYLISQNKWFMVSAFSPGKYFFITLLNDITKQKLTEQQLKQASDIVMNIQIGLHIYHLEDIHNDRSLRMVGANPITEVFTGLAPDQVIGKTLDENFPGLRAKNIPQRYAEVVRSKQPLELEDVYYGDNRVIQGAFSVKAFPLPDDHMGVSFENITERKKTERKVAENQEFTERLLNTSPNIIYIYDVIKQSNVFSSKNIVDSLGFSSAEIKNMGKEIFPLLLHPDDIELVKAHHQKLSVNSGSEIREITYRLRDKQGQWIWFLSRDVVFQRDSEGKATQILGTAMDITQKKKNEERLKILEKFAEASTQGLGIANLDEELVYINPALSRFLEEDDPRLVLGEKFTKYIPERLHTVIKHQILPEVLSEGDWSGESYIKTKNGKEIVTFESFFLLQDEAGKPMHIAVIINDITEHKRIEKELDDYRNNLEILMHKKTLELKKSEEKFSNLYHKSPDMYVSVSSENAKIIMCNHTLVRRTGYSFNEIIGKPVFEMYHSACQKKVEKLFLEFQKTGEIKNEELVLLKKDGGTIDVELNVSAEYDKEGNIVHSLSSWRDISLRKIAQKKLKLSEQKFKALFYENHSVMLLLEPDTGKIVDANQAACNYYKCQHEQLIKMNIKQINVLTDQEIKEEIAKALREKRNHFFFRHKLVTNEIKDVEVYSGKVLIDNKVLLYSIVHDITERIKAEKALKKSENELKLLNARKDKFFTIVAHDLKGPMGALQQLAEILFTSKDTLEPKELEMVIEYLFNSAKTTNSLLYNLLIWAQFQLNRLEIEPESINIKDLVLETTELHAENARSKRISIQHEIKDKLYAFADKNSIHTVLRNLISNAIHHTPKGGIIKIHARENKEKYIEVEVSDNGVGIPHDKLNKLFKIDEDISTPGTENEKGTGLGLILCKEFIEKNEGRIWVQSELNKGSTFSFSLRTPQIHAG